MLVYSARDQNGKLIRGFSDAKTKEELVRSLHARDLIVISIQEKRQVAEPLKKPIKLHKGVKVSDLTIFARQLAVLLESGVTILKALNVLGQQIESAPLSRACKKMEEDLKSGISLKDAIAKYPKIFSQIWIDLIETGEATGQLAFVLQKLADYFDSVWSLRKKVFSALVYPAALVFVSTVAILVFMYRVIPVFTGIYKGFGELPTLTKIVLAITETVTHNMGKIIGAAIILGYIFKKYVKTKRGRKRFDGFLLKIPILNDLMLSIAIERFSTSLGMMLKGGISIVHALEIAIKSTGNKVVEEALEKVRANVIEGKTISAPLGETGIFPPIVTQMISVGEESGRLSQLLDEVSKFYAEDISTKITRFVAIFEPAILMIMGVIIATLVMAMYLPIFGMATKTGIGG